MDRRHLFAIVRVDLYQLEDGTNPDWRNTVTVKAVVETQERAESEVTRLNQLNAEKGCLYFWQTTRFLGTAKGSGDAG
jgi:hypothetical protein